MSDSTAYYQGYLDALDFNACDPEPYEANYGYNPADDYREGYGDGMDVNLDVNGGICPDYLRGEPEDLDEWGW